MWKHTCLCYLCHLGKCLHSRVGIVSRTLIIVLILMVACHTGIMVSKIDQCMLDLMRYHGEGEDHEPQELGSSVEPVATASATVTASSQSPKASDMNRVAAGNRLTSHRPQSPLSESDVSEASQSPALSDTPPLAKPLRSSSPAPMASIDDKYL